MDKNDVIARAKEMLGPKSIVYQNAKHYLIFDKTSPNCQILPSFKLHELLTKNKNDTYTRIDTKILARLQNIADVYGGKIKILKSFSYVYETDKNASEKEQLEHEEGYALDIAPVKEGWEAMRLLHIAVRKVEFFGSRAMYEDHVHIGSGPRWYKLFKRDQ